MQRRHALEPRRGVAVFPGIEDPPRQGHHSQRTRVSTQMQAVLCLRGDPFVEQVLGEVGTLLVCANKDGHVGPPKPRRHVVTDPLNHRLVQPLLARLVVLFHHGLHVHFALEGLLGVLLVACIHVG